MANLQNDPCLQGKKKNIENYCPIANLCSASKIFEKLILKRIMGLQTENDFDSWQAINSMGSKNKEVLAH